MVLATDLKKHFEYISRLRSVQFLSDFTYHWAERGQALAYSSDRMAAPRPRSTRRRSHLHWQACLKFHDLGHSCKVWEQHERWTEWVTEEFYLLGDKEKAMSGARYVSPLCDRKKDKNVPKSK